MLSPLKIFYIILFLFFILIFHSCSSLFNFITQDDDDEKPKIVFNRDEKNQSEKNPNDKYKDTEEAAHEIEGDSILHVIYNTMLKISNSSSYPNIFQPYVIAGIASRETQMLPGTWIFDFGLPSDTDVKKFTIYGYKDALQQFRETGHINISYTGAIGTMQVQPVSYFNNEFVVAHGAGSAGANSARAKYNISGHSSSKFEEVIDWDSWVNSTDESKDFSGDSKGDLFNPLDALGYSKLRFEDQYESTLSKYELLSDQYKEDIYVQGYYQMYLGVPSFYTRVEANNPLMQMFRKAAEEYHNNGQRYQEFKSSVEDGDPSVRRNEAKMAVWNLYKDNGWSLAGSGSSITSATKGSVTVSSSSDMALYAISAYWGGRVVLENIEKVLKETSN